MTDKWCEEPAMLPEHKKGSARAADLPPTSELAERLRNGETVADLAAQYGMTKGGFEARLRTAGWGARGEKTTEGRNWTPCGWCGRKAFGTGDVCRGCRGTEANASLRPTAADELKGGRWVNRNGVSKWVPDPEPTPIRGKGKRAARGGPLMFSEEERRRGHNLFIQGCRTDFAIAANREYKRAHARKIRAEARLDDEVAA